MVKSHFLFCIVCHEYLQRISTRQKASRRGEIPSCSHSCFIVFTRNDLCRITAKEPKPRLLPDFILLQQEADAPAPKE